MNIKMKIKDIFVHYNSNKEELYEIYKESTDIDYNEIRETDTFYVNDSLTKKRIGELKRNIFLREILYQLLDEEEKILIQYKYDLKLDVYEICYRMYMSESTYYRKQRKIYRKFEEYYNKFGDLFN